MKKLYLVIALLVAMPLSLISKVDMNAGSQPHNQNLPSVTKEFLLNYDNHSKDKKFMPQTLGKFNIIDTTVDVVFNGFYGGSTNMAYEPISKTLFMVQSNRFTTSEDDQILDGVIYLYYSQDNGASWTREVIFNQDGSVPVDPSVSVTNPKKSTNPNDLYVVVMNRYFKYDAFQDTYLNVGGLYVINDGVGLTDNNFFEFEEPGPVNNNPGYYWSLAAASSFSGDNESYSYFSSTLNSRDTYQYGMYGVSNMKFNSNDGLISNSSSMPTNWGALVWRSSDAIGSSYNAPVYLDVDENGTLYAAFNNFFADNQEVRTISISKSTDNGETWSDFERFPQATWDAYNQKYNLESSFSPGLLPYSTNGFAVTGVDEYSYITTFWKQPLDTNIQEPEGVLVEFYKVGGEWKIRDVAPTTIDTYRRPYLIQDTNSTIAEDVFLDSPRGYEIQLAKTADNQNLLLKYIDNRDSLAILNDTLTLLGGGIVEATLSTDIFVAYRDAADQNGWSTPVSITNDVWMNKVTHIPHIIPSLTQVPIIEHVTVDFRDPENPRLVNGYPKFIQNFIVGSYVRNWILFSSFDATQGEIIRNDQVQKAVGVDGITSVDELINIDVNSFNVYPNPVSSTASISYEIANNAYVKIEIFNNMGELVKTVREYSLATVGITGFEFDASDLASGSYYISMTANGKKVTKLLNVVR